MIRIIKKIGRLLDHRQKGKVIVILIMMVVGAFLEVLSVSLLIPLISVMMQPDIIENNRLIGGICEIFGIYDKNKLLVGCLVVLIVVFVAKNIYLIVEYYVQYRFIYNNRFNAQKRIMNFYMHKPYEYFLHADSGEIIRIVSTDVENSYRLLMELLSIATELIVSTMMIIAVFVINPAITAITGIVMGLTVVIITKILMPQLRKAGKKRQEAHAALNKWLLQSINGIKEIKIFQAEGYFQNNYDKNGRIMVRAEQKNSIYRVMPRMFIEMTTTCTAMTVIVILALRGEDISNLVPALSAFVMAAVKLLPSANRIVSAFNQIAYQEPALDQLLKKIEIIKEKGFQKTEREVSNKSSYLPQRKIELLDVVYSYPGVEKPVLMHASMCIPIGRCIGIIGVSGAGKTTVMDVLLGLLKPQSGQVLCDGKDISDNLETWYPDIGYIPQMIFMLDDTIRANVAFGVSSDDIDDDKVWKVLDKAQLGDFVRSLPDKLNTGIGERGIRISGGQRQRIGIARALYTDPSILLFDEATSALDNDTEKEIVSSIDALHGEKTIIIVAHRLSTIKNCDIIYKVENGKIIEETN